MDLIVFYSPEKATMTYYINNEQAGYKIEYPFACIKNIHLDNGDQETGHPGGLVVELNRPPNFFMDSSGSGGFFQCGDFTEDQQASQIMVHHLGGHPKVLSGQLAKLISLEAFTNRFSPFDHHPLAVSSAPVSPIGRPSSQPNFHAQAHVGMYQESQWGINMTPGRAPGHKRQRSRSVPMAVDFSMFGNPMPSFLIQHPSDNINSNNLGQHAQSSPHNSDIFAPIPQQANTALGNNLRIDTSTGYGMDYRQFPMSAATTTGSPADFPSPSFYTPHPVHDPSASGMTTPYAPPQYNIPFLSPMLDPSAMVPNSISPLSFMSHHDPAIVDQSPPMAMLHRSASASDVDAELYPSHHLHGGLGGMTDDGTGLEGLYSKHTLNLPMHPHSPYGGSMGGMGGGMGRGMGGGMGGTSADGSPAAYYRDDIAADLDMNQLVQFDGVDNSGLSPEGLGGC